MVLADMIFPLFTLPYDMFLGAPLMIVLALLVEGAVFFWMRRPLDPRKIMAGTLGANVLSWMAGMLLFTLLPLPNIGSYYEMAPNARGLHYGAVPVLLAFLVAFVLSVLLEFLVWKLVVRKIPGVMVFVPTVIANAASYLLLLAALFVFQGFSLVV
jgi:hypothetical protein